MNGDPLPVERAGGGAGGGAGGSGSSSSASAGPSASSAITNSDIRIIIEYILKNKADGSNAANLSPAYIRQMIYKIIQSQRAPMIGAGHPDNRAVIKDLICGRCKYLVGSTPNSGNPDPILLPDCGHMMCRSCAHSVLGTCPTCNKQYTKDVIDSLPTISSIKTIVGSLVPRASGGVSPIPRHIIEASEHLIAYLSSEAYPRKAMDEIAISEQLYSLIRSQLVKSGERGAIYKDLGCPICFELVGLTSDTDHSDPIVVSCGHIFCRACIRGVRSNTCPTCRARIELVTDTVPHCSVAIASLISRLQKRDGEFGSSGGAYKRRKSHKKISKRRKSQKRRK